MPTVLKQSGREFVTTTNDIVYWMESAIQRVKLLFRIILDYHHSLNLINYHLHLLTHLLTKALDKEWNLFCWWRKTFALKSPKAFFLKKGESDIRPSKLEIRPSILRFAPQNLRFALKKLFYFYGKRANHRFALFVSFFFEIRPFCDFFLGKIMKIQLFLFNQNNRCRF